MTNHFWDKNGDAHALIQNLYNLPSNYSQEDIVDHIWSAICHFYFSPTALSPNGPRWTVLREAYRGPQIQLSQHKPNILAVWLQPRQVMGGTRVYGRDCLWVECKPPSHDTPSGWKDLIHEATQRLNSAHPQRTVALIVAVGLQMIPFWWDPTNVFAGCQLKIPRPGPSQQGNEWPLDQRLKGWPLGMGGVGASWIDPNSGTIDLTQALTVDCISQQIVNGQRVLRWRNELTEIEQLLISIRQMTLPVFQGWNSAHWSS